MQWVRLLKVGLAVMGVFVATVAVGSLTTVYAVQSSSTNYMVNEAFFGTGGQLNSCSTLYCSKQAAGEMTVGRTASTNYSAQAGFNTDREPSLTFIVGGSNADLGGLSKLVTSTATGTFSVKTYLSGGYVVQTASDPPTSPGPSPHTFTNLTTPTASAVGNEQFGINLVANTNPISFGASPVQVPSTTFSFGAAATGYNTANLYKYVKGDTVASSTKSSGQTDYTVSYIYNISELTPSGTYTFNQVLVATSTF